MLVLGWNEIEIPVCSRGRHGGDPRIAGSLGGRMFLANYGRAKLRDGRRPLDGVRDETFGDLKNENRCG